jgi:cation:H+ antiporter
METYLSSLPLLVLLPIFLVALFALSKTADGLVDQAVAIAEILKLPQVVIGATIVSLGTTLPEVATTVMAVSAGSPGISLGNALGSVVTNITLIIGVTALITKVPVSKAVAGSYNFFFIASLIMMAAAYIGGHNIPQWIGILFLLLLPLYLYMQFKSGSTEEIEVDENAFDKKQIGKYLLLMIAFAAGVALSASLLVASVKVGARQLGVPESIIGITIVALGTSLPELTTAIQSARRGAGAMAIGNVLGANILNLLLVLGLGVAMSKGGMTIPDFYYTSTFPLIALILAIFGLFIYNTKIHAISKKEGIGLLVIYGVFLFLSIMK